MRLPAGGRGIDRTREVSFEVDGRRYVGVAGDTIASALIAAGRVECAPSISRSRPRGIVAAGVEEPNALVEVRFPGDPVAESMLPATMVEVADGMTARFLAGVGRLDPTPDHAIYDHRHVHADVVVVGAGPAGIAAAQEAAAVGARTILMDEQAEPGGSLRATRAGAAPVADALAGLRATPDVAVLSRTTAVGSYDAGYVVALERRGGGPPRQRVWHVRAREVIVATGAHERPIVFRNNDRPGIMLAGAVRTYLNRYAACAGESVVVATTNDTAYDLVEDLAAAGIRVAAVIDARPDPTERARAVRDETGVAVRAGSAVVDTEAGPDGRVSAVVVSALDDDAMPVGERETIACNLLAVSGGHSPVVHLHSQRQGRLHWSDELAAFVPAGGVPGQRVVGAAAGAFDHDDAVAEGREAGRAAATDPGAPAPLPPHRSPAPIRPLWLVPGDTDDGSSHVVDLQRDQTVADVLRATGAGMRSVEHIKRYTTISTANDQGKTSGVNAIGVIAAALNEPDLGAVGTTTFRAPYTPVAFAALAGRARGQLADPVRVTSIHPRHVALGAVFEDVGQWKRPRYYPRPGEDMDTAVLRECAAARESVALMDVSTLGKIEIRGADAGELLNRIYTNGFAKLPVGKSRYGVMCTADGMIFDDGVTTRLAENRFVMTTTTGGAASVLDWLEEWHQTEWPGLEVMLTSVTEQWASVAVTGPRSRDVLRELCPGLDVSAAGFEFMSLRETTLANGIPARVARISFSGELAYEVSVAAFWGSALWDAVVEAGTPHGITPYGTETMHVLRAEKGFIIVGQDTDGTVTPHDAGMEWIVSTRKDFVGKRSFARPEAQRRDRRHLVGILPVDGATRVEEGAQLVEAGAEFVPPVPMIGHVTSAYRSAALGRPFGLALVDGGRDRIGEVVSAFFLGHVVDVEITSPVFVDPDGSRRDGDPAVPDPEGAPGSPGADAPGAVPRPPGPAPESPAARLAGEMSSLTGAAVLRERPLATQVGIRVAPGSAAARVVEDALGIPLPSRRGAVAGDVDALHAIWLGPDEFLAIDPTRVPGRDHPIAALDEPGTQILDLSANRAILELEGEAARDVLETGCPDDLHPRAFPVGAAIVTRLGAVPIILHRTAETTYRLLPRPSYAEHLVRWILDAAPAGHPRSDDTFGPSHAGFWVESVI